MMEVLVMSRRYTPTETREVPEVCPLMSTCKQIRTDKEEYARLVKKWTEYAKSQEPEELNIESRVVKVVEGKRVVEVQKKTVLDRVEPVTGTQVFHLEYGRTPEKAERFARMCPHFKRDVLGLATSDPPYHDCTLFSEWYYRQKR